MEKQTAKRTRNMNIGDIIYVKKPYTALYGKTGGSYEYHFVPGDMYVITYVYGLGGIGIKNTNGDGIPHWVGGDIEERFYTQKEWREIQLKELGILDIVEIPQKSGI